MNYKRAIVPTVIILGLTTLSAVWFIKNPNLSKNRNLVDDALLALIKNDQKAFEAFVEGGGNLHDTLPEIDGKNYSVAEGISYFERTAFAKNLSERKINYVTQDKDGIYDIMTLAIIKNNPELLNQLALEKPQFDMAYGKKGWTLLHMASANCSHKLTAILHSSGLRWDQKAKDGSTPMTLAAESECLPMLSYWKEQKADFNSKDGTGLSALSILRKKKDAAINAFAQSFESKISGSVKQVATSEPDFYKKRKIPKDQIIDHAAMIEPEDRPLEATETAELSEFAD